ncbi:putative pyridoxine 5'-phosphate oxidase superfamily flavin-nucleotide-binding protein [Methylobacterium sp. BE186]|uniref:pyridoxamine 5'-phosphate oxidase family protein n=1 Tax=Methylobacterium sp. BE186 TaxID=2817715 RepID=UPI00285996DD|nr:pyridoxamine 5'-phosphate oxidase family protein [Methylobacterium sp. BE186]MDR7036313.1 putative pyridoxine 5'-phosphate oxidase superfamily flavin-nucleotide-binding protein [Methylobacterium sp. BE186]
MDTPSFHADEVAAQALGDGVIGDTPAIRAFMPEQHRGFFAGLPYLFVGLVDHTGAPVATLLSGPPGFVSAEDPVTLRVSALPPADDPAAPALRRGAEIGLLGLDLATRRRNRANGSIAAIDSAGFTVSIAQSFGNCPKYIQRRDVEAVPRVRGPTEALDGLDDRARALIEGADTFLVASRARAGIGPAGGADISHRGGRPGFVRVQGNVLTIPDFAGNRYFNTLGNLLGEKRASLLFIDFERGDILTLQGEALIDWSGAEAAGFAGAHRSWRFRTLRGWWRPAAVPLRWSFLDASPFLTGTGGWSAPA